METERASGPIIRPPQLGWMIKRAREDPEGFWGEVAEELYWFRRWDRVFEWDYPQFRWFVGGVTNLAFNAVDYHVLRRGRGNRAALVWESAETGQTRTLTYNQLLYEVQRFAAALRALGVGRGDRVTVYMPMVPEAAVAMLAATRIGAIHSVVFGGFGPNALADRILAAEPRVVVTADLGYRRGKAVNLKGTLDEALRLAEAQGFRPAHVVTLRRGGREPPMAAGRDLLWEEALEAGKAAGENGEAARLESNEYAFILHTSGTTAKPKGVVHTHGGYQVYIYAMGKWVYDMRESDVWWSTSDIGWIVGHSYVVYAPLLVGCTTLMFEGTVDHPAPDVLWRVIERNRVTQLWVSPTAVRTLMKYGDEWPRRYDLGSVRLVACAGEVLNPAAWEWLQRRVFGDRVPVIDHMWQTESGGPMVGNPYGVALMPIKPGSAAIPLPGVEGDVVDGEGRSLPPGVKGVFVCRRPFPGLTPTLWREPEKYVKDYWERIPGCYYTGDAAFRDEDGYIWFVGRGDEVIKIAAHRIGAVEVESALLQHPAVAESAVVGKPDPVKGEVACAFVVLKAGHSPNAALPAELREVVRTRLGPIVVLDEVRFVGGLPKTRSGKIMRRLIRAVLTGQPLGDYSTIEDEATLEEIREAYEELRRELG